MFVKKSKKFGAWDSSSSSSAPGVGAAPVNCANGVTKTGSGTVTISKGKRVSLDDVVNVAINQYQVVYDAGAAHDAIEVPCRAIPVTKTSKWQNEYQVTYVCRAAVFARIVALLNGPLNWREQIIETLVDLLNTNVIPCFSDVMLAGAQLVAALTGSSNALFYVNDRVLSMEQVLADDLFNPVGLTASEANCLAQSPCVVVGSVSLVAAGAARLASIVDCVSALSCEAFGAAVAPFDAAIFENYKQHRGQLNSASNLRALLEGSMRVNTPSSKDDSVLRVFAALPQSTGPAVDAIVASAK
jgi:hypothetical protein